MPSGPSCGICCRCRGGSRARAAGPEGYCRRQMIDAVREEARRLGCAYLVLDTGLANSLAQRFYFRQRLLSKGLHFSQAL